MQKNYLFYLANLAPELGRMEHFLEQGNSAEYARAQHRAEAVVTSALADTALSHAGHAELSQLRGLIVALGVLPSPFLRTLTAYAYPFAERFAMSR